MIMYSFTRYGRACTFKFSPRVSTWLVPLSQVYGNKGQSLHEHFVPPHPCCHELLTAPQLLQTLTLSRFHTASAYLGHSSNSRKKCQLLRETRKGCQFSFVLEAKVSSNLKRIVPLTLQDPPRGQRLQASVYKTKPCASLRGFTTDSGTYGSQSQRHSVGPLVLTLYIRQ